MNTAKEGVSSKEEPRARAPKMSDQVIIVKTDSHDLEGAFMYAFAEDPHETEALPVASGASRDKKAGEGMDRVPSQAKAPPESQGGDTAKKGPVIRGPPGAMRTAQSILRHMGRPMGMGMAPLSPPFVAMDGGVAGDDSFVRFHTAPGPGLHPGSSSTSEDTKRDLEKAMLTARGGDAARDFDQDELSIPNWFSLMQSGLDYHDGDEAYTSPCLGLVVSNADVSSSLGSEVFDPDTDTFFLVAPLVSISQSVSSLGALYTYKPDPERRIMEYARFLTSPLVPIAAGSLYPRQAVAPASGVSTVSCEGKVVLRVEDLLRALGHYEAHSPSMKAITDIIRARYPPGQAFSIRCLMRVPVSFWMGDTIMHTVAKVCICTRAPVPLPMPGHLVTPGHKEALYQKWNTMC